MEVVQTLLTILDKYGLPLMVLGVGAFLLWKGVLRMGPDVDRIIAGLQGQIAYTEERRVEERTARLESEERLESNNAALREATAAFKDSNELMQSLMERINAK